MDLGKHSSVDRPVDIPRTDQTFLFKETSHTSSMGWGGVGIMFK